MHLILLHFSPVSNRGNCLRRRIYGKTTFPLIHPPRSKLLEPRPPGSRRSFCLARKPSGVSPSTLTLTSPPSSPMISKEVHPVFGIDGGEFVILILFAFFLFGPRKLPGIARTVGKGLRELRQTSDDLKRSLENEVAALDYTDEPGSSEPKSYGNEETEPYRSSRSEPSD